MKLQKFRITNYKTIENSGWIDTDDVTSLVGKNESGKTSLLRALSKLNPTDDAKLDPLKDFPRSRYTKDYENEEWKAVEATFEISQDDLNLFIGWHDAFNKLETVTFHKYYGDALKYSFYPPLSFPEINLSVWRATLNDFKKFVERISIASLGATQQEAAKTKRSAIVEKILEAHEERPTIENIETIRSLFVDEVAGLPDPPNCNKILEKIDEFEEILKNKQLENRAFQEIKPKLPKFIYFDNYEMINGAIFLPEFIRRIESDRLEQGTRVQRAIFSQVNADVNDLITLSGAAAKLTNGQNREADPAQQTKFRELTIKANSAGLSLTKDFGDWWKQGGYKFHYKFSGEYFEIWVSDEIQDSEIELEERSAGFRYFFSFFLLFSVEAKDMHDNCILLLDEPGTHLHGTAQMDLIEFFDRLALDNQLIYSTHSPFMVDGDRLDRARAVVKTANGTEVSTDIWPNDKDSVFALQGALGYSICQSLFISKYQILVEGPSDYLLLHAINSFLPENERLSAQISMIPIGGCSNLVPYASLLLGHDLEFFVILDSDNAGKSAKSKLIKMLGDDSRIATYGSLVESEKVVELEDLIPVGQYIKAVNSSHSELKIEVDADLEGKSVVQHCKDSLKVSGHSLNKLDVTRELIRRLALKSDPIKSPLMKFGSEAYSKINTVFKLQNKP